MLTTAYELTGYTLDEKQLTRNIFHSYKQKYPFITLDQAILLFEKSTDSTLEAFAYSKHRTAASYRKVYKPYFK